MFLTALTRSILHKFTQYNHNDLKLTLSPRIKCKSLFILLDMNAVEKANHNFSQNLMNQASTLCNLLII